MATLAPTNIDRVGNNITSPAAAAAGGDAFDNSGVEFVYLKNEHATVARTVTFDVQGTVDGQAITDKAINVPALSGILVGPFPPEIYNNSSGQVAMTYSTEADLKVKVLRVVGLRRS